MSSASTLAPGDRFAVLSPSFAAPGCAPAIHEQAIRRLVTATGLVPVECPSQQLAVTIRLRSSLTWGPRLPR